MESLTIAKVIDELSVVKSSLSKRVNYKKGNIEKIDAAGCIWNKEVIDKIKNVINKGEDRDQENVDIKKLINKYNLRVGAINNRRYLGNKYSLRNFIRETVDANCQDINIFVDIFSGTGAVADSFKDKIIITNDLLYSNYIANYAWFSAEKYSKIKIIEYIIKFNSIKTMENNYMRLNFADTFFSADDCSKIGNIREQIDLEYKKGVINFKEFSILVTSLLYGMDRIANTVGHYDAYRKNGKFEKELVIPLILPDDVLNENNCCYNDDANTLIEELESDLLYLDPPYNSRQYSDAYHLLENVACWEQPAVFGVAKKMDRKHIKSDYCLMNATEVFEELINKANTKYILLSYNNMGNKGNERSNAKIMDEDILRILRQKGKVTVFEKSYKSFSTGKSNIENNSERLFLCETFEGMKKKITLACPFNYTGGKYKLLPQIKPLLAETSNFLDLFAGGCNVGINSNAGKIIFNDLNTELIGLLSHFKNRNTESVLDEIDHIIKRYKLSRTDLYGYKYYQCNSSQGLAVYNKDKYLKLRNDYNNQLKQGNFVWNMLYVLIVYSFNNQIRFNKKGEFNLPVGKRDFNSRMRNKLKLFCEALKKREIQFMNKDFRDIKLELLQPDTLIYCDPPYLITTATYNESGIWTTSDEQDLLNYLEKAEEMGFKFALSNVLSSKGKDNMILSNWLQNNNFKIHQLDKNYSNSNYQRKNRQSFSNEVLITNY